MRRGSDSTEARDAHAARRRRALSLIVWGTLILSAPSALERVTLVANLAPLPLLARGAVAANERLNPLGLAGYHGLREKIAREGADPARSGIAKAWGWVASLAPRVPPNARVRVNAPHLAAYYFASFLWFPARVELPCGGRPVGGAETLVDACFVAGADVPGLAAEGYTHALVQTADGGVRLLALRSAAGGAR